MAIVSVNCIMPPQRAPCFLPMRVRLPSAGMNKMVINHLDKLFVTSDAHTIIDEMEVQHPAAKLVVFASRAQEQEIGDGTNFVRPDPDQNPTCRRVMSSLPVGSHTEHL